MTHVWQLISWNSCITELSYVTDGINAAHAESFSVGNLSSCEQVLI